LTPHKLWELVQLGDDAPGWMYSRWCVEQAYRWMLIQCDRRTDDAALQTMIVAHASQAEEVADDEIAFGELGTRVAAGDWLCQQLATYDFGGLTAFLDMRAGGSLLNRCDQVRDWADVRMSGYLLEEPRGSCIRVRDLNIGAPLDVLNIGLLTDRDPDMPVIGRVVPVVAAPGLMFESRPVSVDLRTAEEVAAASTHEDPAYWITAIGDGRYDERLEYAFSCGRGTLFSSDIVPLSEAGTKAIDELEPPGRLVELRRHGLDDLQANGVMVAEMALIAVQVSGTSAAQVLAAHVAAVILEARVYAAMREHCTARENASGWTILADCSVEPARSRCIELARLCAA
jgi:hypothetical protein